MSNFSYQKNWMFTVNNPASELDEPILFLQEFAKYGIYQLEVGEYGTPHYQGYVHFNVKKRIAWIKENIHATAHWEGRRGTHAEAKAYCSKDETRAYGALVVEWGEEPSPGVRNDLIELKKSLDDGKCLKEISDIHFGSFLKYSKGIKEYTMLQAQLRDWITFTQVYWGEPGVGKSTRAKHEAGENAYWLEKPNSGGTLWFDGYDGHECVVIDEFYGWVSRDTMQRMCDSTPYRVQVKGGFVPFTAKKIIITSNTDPEDWWPRVGLGDQMRRRLVGIHGDICEMKKELDEDGRIVVWNPAIEPPVEDNEALVGELHLEEIASCISESPQVGEKRLSVAGDVGAGARYDSDNEVFEDLSEIEDLEEDLGVSLVNRLVGQVVSLRY